MNDRGRGKVEPCHFLTEKEFLLSAEREEQIKETQRRLLPATRSGCSSGGERERREREGGINVRRKFPAALY